MCRKPSACFGLRMYMVPMAYHWHSDLHLQTEGQTGGWVTCHYLWIWFPNQCSPCGCGQVPRVSVCVCPKEAETDLETRPTSCHNNLLYPILCVSRSPIPLHGGIQTSSTYLCTYCSPSSPALSAPSSPHPTITHTVAMTSLYPMPLPSLSLRERD
jgi:hypothetical protein